MRRAIGSNYCFTIRDSSLHQSKISRYLQILTDPSVIREEKLSFSFYLKLGVSVSALGVFSATSLAQTETSEDASDASSEARRLSSVTVTGERREASLLDTPVAISAYDSETRDSLGILDANDVADYTPGMTYQVSPNRISIRGIGRLDNALGTDPGVATYIDNTYTPDALTLDRSPLFVERIEVLRGPQGTLFGRNSVGGLVNIISKRPVFEPETEVRLRAGSMSSFDAALTNSGPLFGSDSTAYRVNLQGTWMQEGRYDNTFSGTGEIGADEEQYSIDVQLSHDFTDNLSAWGRYRTEFVDGTAVPSRRADPYDFRGPNTTPALAYFQSITTNPLYGLNQVNPSVDDPLAQSLDFAGRSRFEDVHEFVWEVAWETEAFDVKYLGSNTQRSFDFSVDSDGTSRASHTLDPLDPTLQDAFGRVTSTFQVTNIGDDLKTESHELQFLSNGDGPLSWIGGLYYYKEQSEQPFAIAMPQAVAAGTPLNINNIDFTQFTGACEIPFVAQFPDFLCGISDGLGEANPDNNVYFQTGDLTTTAYAAYGQVDYEFGDGWTFKAGLRYTLDEKEGTEEQQIYQYDPSGTFSLAGQFGIGSLVGAVPSWIQLTPNNNTRTLENEWDAWSGTLGLSREFGEEGLVYAQYTRGYKAGGMRLGQLTPDRPETPNIDERFVEEEIVDAFELGLKSLALDGALRFSASAFYYDYQDQQSPVDFINNAGTVQQFIVNVPEATTAGLEIETLWAPTDELQLGFNYGYLDTEIESFDNVIIDPVTGVATSQPVELQNIAVGLNESVVGNTLPRSPEHSLTAFAGYTLFMDSGANLTFLGDWTYTDEMHNTLFDDPVYTIDANDRTSLRAIWNNANGDLTVIGSVSNVFDDNTPDSVGVSNAFVGRARQEEFINQRTFFVELQKRF